MPTHLYLAMSGDTRMLKPHAHANGLRALLLAWFDAADSELARALHDADQPKPYSISPLVAQGPRRCQCRVSLLDDALLPLLLFGLEQRGAAISLGPFHLTLHPSESRMETRGWDELLAVASPPPCRWSFALDTPTAHHQAGVVRKVLVTPLPESCFGGWWRRWNLFAPAPMPGDLPALIAERMTIAALHGETRQLPLDRGRRFIGFTGEVAFHLLAPPCDFLPERRCLTALARLAPYCGTGVDTVRGMGQTRYLEQGRGAAMPQPAQ